MAAMGAIVGTSLVGLPSFKAPAQASAESVGRQPLRLSADTKANRLHPMREPTDSEELNALSA
jgi:hypothetical protein